MKKRITCFLLAIVMIAALLPISAVPANAEPEEGDKTDYLCFTAVEKGSVGLKSNGSGWTLPTVEYSTDGKSWKEYAIGSDPIELEAGEKVLFRGDNPDGFSKSLSNYAYFVIRSGKIAASGNVMTLIDPTGAATAIPCDYCFYKLFDSCGSLTAAPKLPATTLKKYCYNYMFSRCSLLTSVEILPATTLANACYAAMFYQCTSLSEITVWTYATSYSYFSQWINGVATTGTLRAPTVTLSVISGNNMTKAPSDWTMIPYYEVKMNVTSPANGTLTTDAERGAGKIYAAEGETVTLTAVPASGYAVDTLTVNNGDVEVTRVNDTTYTFTMPASTVTVAATFALPDLVCDGITFKAWTSSTSLPMEGNYYLTQDVDVTSRGMVNSGKTLNLCLNGHIVTQTSGDTANGGSFYRIDGTLNLYDSDNEIVHEGYLDADGVWHPGTGVGTPHSITGGVLTGCCGMYGAMSTWSASSVLRIYGGTICGNEKYGVYIMAGSCQMMGGTIGNNNGYGVYNQKSEFTMSGGTIGGNTGTGVYNSGAFAMTGGHVTENKIGMVTENKGVAPTVTLGGTAVIAENRNANLQYTGEIIFSSDPAPRNGMSIGLSGGLPAVGMTEAYAKFLFFSGPRQYMEYNATTGKLVPVAIPDGGWKITVSQGEHGALYAAPYAMPGETVTLDIFPENGYALKSLSYNDGTGHDITDAKSFVMPDTGVTVTATFEKTTLAYTGTSLTLGSVAELNFYMELPDTVGTDGEMTFVIGDRRVTAEAKSNEKGTYFACPLTALEFAETVEADFVADGVTYAAYFAADDYIEALLAGNYSDETKTLARKIANYGHYMQLYLEDIHENVVIGDGGYRAIGEYGDTWAVDPTAATEALTGEFDVTEGGGVTLYGITALFDSATALNYYVTVESGEAPTASCAGKNVTVERYSGNVYRVSLTDINATELGTVFTVTIGDAVYAGSVMDYCGAVIAAHNGGTEEDAVAIRAMAAFYEYYQAADAYAKAQ